MRLIVNMPNSLYANLTKIVNGSIAGKRILECVKHGEPYKVDVLDEIISEATSLKISYADHDKDTYRRGINDVVKIIDKYKAESEG